jgi:hypothetical protein
VPLRLQKHQAHRRHDHEFTVLHRFILLKEFH